MADSYLPAEPPIGLDDDGDLDGAAVEYVELGVRLEVGARILLSVAYVAMALWAVVVASGIWVYWDQISMLNEQQGGITSHLTDTAVLPQVIVSVAQTTWGYLAVAVLAYSAALLVDSRRLPVLLEAIVDDDEDEPAAD